MAKFKIPVLLLDKEQNILIYGTPATSSNTGTGFINFYKWSVFWPAL